MRAAIALTRLSKRERRTVSLALALLVGGVVLGRGGPALAEWTARARLERDALADSLGT